MKAKFLRLWAKMFGAKTGAFDTEIGPDNVLYLKPAYDPAEDQEKILMGENESYFD